MSLVINTNVPSLNAQRNLGINNSQLGKSLERLSSGLRINRAADDAAGLAIATKFQGQVRGLGQAVRNVNNAVSLVQTAEAGITTLTNILQRLRELAVQSASDDNTTTDRSMLTSESSNLISEFTRVASTSEFNTMALLDGTFSGKYFQVGANYSQLLTFQIGDARGKALGGRAQLDANISDGLTNSASANFGGSEFKINGAGVAATSSTDDQYSVLEVAGGSITAIGATSAYSGVYDFMINNTAVSVTLATSTGGMTAASIVDITISAVNAARITNVSAYAIGSTWALRATNGADIELAISTTTTASAAVASLALAVFGLGNVSALFGSTATSTTDITSYNGQSSAIAKAVAINAVKSTSGVTATTQANVVTGVVAVAAGTIASGDVSINGVNIGALTVTASDGTGALSSAINANTSTTGVTATTDSTGKLMLTAADGRNINVTVKTVNDASTAVNNILNLATTPANVFTNGVAVFRSTVRLTSEKAIDLSGTLVDLLDNNQSGTPTEVNANAKTTLSSKSQAKDLATYNISKILVDTQANAQAAILTLDSAFNDTNLLRSQLGAIQNRLEFTISNLQSASENFSASESRIRDADFASETGKLTRNQILVQAGTAMLAQANQLSQLALQLLK